MIVQRNKDRATLSHSPSFPNAVRLALKLRLEQCLQSSSYLQCNKRLKIFDWASTW